MHAVQRLRRDLPGRDRAGADHQPAPPPAGRGGRARPEPPVDARGDPQVRQLVRREQAQARPLDRRARLRGPGRAQASRSTCSGSSATTRRSTPARSASRARWRASSTRPGSTSGSSTTASATRATTCAGSARRGCSRCSPSRTSRRSRSCEFERIVTSDPHSLNTLRNEYPDLGGELDGDPPHDPAARADRERPPRARADGSSYRVTYHDPCHLGRMNGEYDAPRRILERLGCTLIEMPRNRDNSFCCGAGGGRIWIADPPGAERPVGEPDPRGGRRCPGSSCSSSPARRT